MKLKNPLKSNFLGFFLTFLAITVAPTLFVPGAIPGLLAAEPRPTQYSPAKLVSALAEEDAVARLIAEEQLVKMGDAAIPALEPLATSPGLTLAREDAINILGNIGTKKAIKILLRILDREQEVMVRSVVCRHLGRIGVEEAVPIIGRWLFTIRGKSFKWVHHQDQRRLMGSPRVLSRTYAWMEHVYALSAIGSEKAIPILEKMVRTQHKGEAGRALITTYKQHLAELEKEAEFWQAVRRMPGLEPKAKRLFSFFRQDSLAIIRLYRDKVIRGGIEGRWVLEDLKKHPELKVREAATALLKYYPSLLETKVN